MASFGSLLFYSKNGVSEPFLLSYGKTYIGSSESNHIRIKGEGQISCILDSNEVGVTILVNEDKNVLVNNIPTSKYTVMKNGDQLEFGKKKFMYSNPSLKEEYLEQTRQTLNKKVGTVQNVNTQSEIKSNSSTLAKRVQTAVSCSKQRRFSTGSKVALAKMSPKIIGRSPLLSSHTSTPQSPSKIRFSRRMAARRNSTLASVMENEVFDFHSPKVTPVGKTNPRVSFLAAVESPSVKKNKTFSGTSKFSSPVPAKNKTYSGNVSDVSDNITTPENSITVASITPLNVSKKTNKSMNRSRTLSYVDFPSSSTPKSAIRINRSSSLYRPLVEDITPASPLARSSLRNSSIKMLAFTQRRSVNFNISSSSDHSSQQISGSVNLLEPSSTGSKRKRGSIASMPESPGNAKKSKRTSSRVCDSDHEQEDDVDSLHDSNISGIQNFSDTSLNSNKNGSTKVSTPGKLLTNISFKDTSDSENQSIVSWNVEMSGTDMNLSGLSVCSSITETPMKSKRSTRLSNLNESASSVKEIGNDSRRSTGVKTPGVVQDDCSGSDTISLRLTRSSTSLDSNLEERQHSKRSSLNVSISNLESILNDSLEDMLSVSSRSTRSYIKEIDRGKVRSKSLNLRKENKESKNILSKTLDTNLTVNIPERKSLRNVSSTPMVRSESRKSTIPKSRSKSLNLRNIRSNSLHVPSKASTSMTLNFSPIKPNSSKLEMFGINKLNETGSFVSKMSPSPSSSMLDNSMSNTNLSESMEMYNVEDSVTPEISKRQSTRKTPITTNSEIDSNQSNVSGRNTTKESACKTPKKSPSKVTRDDASDLSSVFNDMSSCNSPVNFLNSDKTNSATLEVVFKTPNAKKALRRLETPNLSFTSTNDPTDIRSMEKLLQESFEKSSRRSSRSSNLAEKSLTGIEDQSSAETSLNNSLKFAETENVKSLRISSPKNRSFKVSSAKVTPRNRKSMTNQQKTPKNDLAETSFTDINDQSSAETSLSKSLKFAETENVKSLRISSPKNRSFKVSSAKVTPRNRKSMTNQQKTPKNDLAETSFTDINDRSSAETSLSKSLKFAETENVKSLRISSPKNRSFKVSSAKVTPRNRKSMTNQQKTPKNDLAETSWTDIDDQSSAETSLSKSFKFVATENVKSLRISSPKNRSFKISSAKVTPRNRKSMKKQQKTPKNDLTDISGVEELLKTPKARMSQKVQNSPINDLSNVSEVKKIMVTPKNTPKNDRTSQVQNSPKNDPSSVGSSNKSRQTPKIQKSPKNDLSKIEGIKKSRRTPKLQKTPKNDLTDVGGIKKLLKTPKVQKTPKNDLTDVGGIKKLLKTPKVQKTPKNDLSNVGGLKMLLKTPKVQRSPKNDLTNVKGLKKLMKTPKVQRSPKNNLTNVGGVKKLMKTPKVQRSPKNDLTNIGGVKKLMKTPKVQRSPKNDLTNIGGVKKLMKTPKVQRSPKNDLTNIGGVKKLMKTPKVQRSPKNDLTNIGGVKKLMKTPKVQRSPKNDLTNVGGVKKLMTTPKLQKSPKNDLTKIYGLKKLMTSPKQQKSLKSHLTKAKGTKKIQKSPKNDLLDVRGVKNLLRTPKNKPAEESYNISGIDNLFNESKESNFDKLFDKKPPRTYGRSPKGNKSQEPQLDEPETPEHVLKWLEEQSKLEPAVQIDKSKSGKRKLEQSLDTPSNIVTPNKKQKVTRSTRAHTSKDVSILNISSSIIDKPSSTPNERAKTTKHISKAEISENSIQTDKNNEQQTGTRSLRGKRKLESNDLDPPSLKRTRETKTSKITSKSNNTYDNEIESPVAKRSLKTRQIKHEDDSVEKLPEETKTRQQKDRKKTEINKDIIIQENLEEFEEKQTIKRTRGKKESDKKISVEETREIKKNTRSRRGKVEAEIVSIEEDTASNKRGNSKQEEVKVESINVDNQPQTKRTRNNKKVEKITEKSIPIEDTPEPTERGRRNIKTKNEEIVSEPEPKTRGRRNQNVEVVDIETKPNRRGKKNTQREIEEESVETEDKSGTKKGGKNSKKNEAQEKKVEPEPKPNRRGKKNTQTETEEESVEIENKSGTKKGVKNSKKNEAQENKVEPEPKPNRRGKKNTQTETEEESVEIENKSGTKKGVKTSKKNEAQENKDKPEPPSRRGKKNTQTDAEEESIEIENKSGTKKGVKNSKKNEAQEHKDESEPPIKKNTRRTKIEDVNSEEKEERTTRSNKGKNKKYNEEEWDTPVKKNTKKQTVTFNDDVEYSKTPVVSIKDGSRNLRKRK